LNLGLANIEESLTIVTPDSAVARYPVASLC
jgi:hypothetical protein